MIRIEQVQFDGNTFTRTYSDAGKKIIQDETGWEYDQAIDPLEWPRTYTESEHDIDKDQEQEEDVPQGESTDKQIYIQVAKILLGQEE